MDDVEPPTDIIEDKSDITPEGLSSRNKNILWAMAVVLVIIVIACMMWGPEGFRQEQVRSDTQGDQWDVEAEVDKFLAKQEHILSKIQSQA